MCLASIQRHACSASLCNEDPIVITHLEKHVRYQSHEAMFAPCIANKMDGILGSGAWITQRYASRLKAIPTFAMTSG